MRPIAMYMFLAVFLVFVGSIDIYIFIRGLQAFPKDSAFRYVYIVLFWIVAASYFAGRGLEGYRASFLSDLLIWTGSFWFAAMLYFLLTVVFLDILRLINHFLPFFPAIITHNYPAAKRIIATAVASAVGLALLAGYINSRYPRVRTLDLEIGKKAGDLKQLNIVVVSDIHLGTIINRSRLEHIVDRINALEPDVVLMPGDIVDEDLTRLAKNSIGDPLMNIRSRFGVYAATGNHEIYSEIEKSSAFLTDHSVTLLQDEAVQVANAFYIIGREDLTVNSRENPRKKLPELMKNVDKSCAIILMDHQPVGLKEAAECGVDLQLSGHTHYGQQWPLNYIVKSVYELAWGHKKIGDTHYYVSNGAGTWGPPVRIGNRPEIVNIRLKFE